MDLNGTTHHVDDVLGDGHTQTCTLAFAHRGTPFTFKGFKNVLGKLLTHTDAVVFHPDLVQALAGRCAVKLCQPNRNGTSGGGELDCIGQQVQHHLIQSGLITEHILVSHINDIHKQIKLFFLNLAADDGLKIVEYFRKIDFRLLQMEFSAFDPAHIQHIVDEGKQVVAGGKNLV